KAPLVPTTAQAPFRGDQRPEAQRNGQRIGVHAGAHAADVARLGIEQIGVDQWQIDDPAESAQRSFARRIRELCVDIEVADGVLAGKLVVIDFIALLQRGYGFVPQIGAFAQNLHFQEHGQGNTTFQRLEYRGAGNELYAGIQVID